MSKSLKPNSNFQTCMTVLTNHKEFKSPQKDHLRNSPVNYDMLILKFKPKKGISLTAIDMVKILLLAHRAKENNVLLTNLHGLQFTLNFRRQISL